MSNPHFTKTEGLGAEELAQKLFASECLCETLRGLITGHVRNTEICLDAMEAAVKRLRDGDGYCPAAALDLLRETLADITGEVEP